MRILKNKLQLFMIVLLVTITACTKETSEEQIVDNSEIPQSALKSYVKENVNYDFSILKRTSDELIDEGGCNYECFEDCSNNVAIANNMESEALLINAFSETMRNFRDDYLSKGETGNAYTNTYYEMSNILLSESLPTVSDVIKNVQIIPTVIEIKNRIGDKDYKGIVIYESEKLELLEFISSYEDKINNSNLASNLKTRYIDITTAIKSDLNNLINRNNTQVIGFLKE